MGAGVLASALCMDKALFKEVMGRAGVPQVDHVAVHAPRWRARPEAVRPTWAASGSRCS